VFNEHDLVCLLLLLLCTKRLSNLRRNTQIKDTCIVFRQWHISSNFTFVLSCLAVVAISLGYEWLRAYQRKVDFQVARALSRKSKARVVSGRTSPPPEDHDAEEAGLLSGRVKPTAL
jgi:copper transporter 1